MEWILLSNWNKLNIVRKVPYCRHWEHCERRKRKLLNRLTMNAMSLIELRSWRQTCGVLPNFDELSRPHSELLSTKSWRGLEAALRSEERTHLNGVCNEFISRIAAWWSCAWLAWKSKFSKLRLPYHLKTSSNFLWIQSGKLFEPYGVICGP